MIKFINKSKIFPHRRLLEKGNIQLDELSAVEAYLSALRNTIDTKTIQVGESGKILVNVDNAVDYAMCLLGAAKALEVVAEKGGLDASRSQHALTLAKQAYEMSGLGSTLYVLNRQLKLGDPTAMEYVSVPKPQWGQFMEWVKSQ